MPRQGGSCEMLLRLFEDHDNKDFSQVARTLFHQTGNYEKSECGRNKNIIKGMDKI